MYIESCYRFLDYLANVKNASVHTIRNYAIDLNALKNFIETTHHSDRAPKPEKIRHNEAYAARNSALDHLPLLTAIDRKTIRHFLAYEQDMRQSNKTLVRRLSSLRSFFKFCCMQNLLSTDPTEELETPKIDKSLPVSLSYDHVRQLMSQPDISTLLGTRDRAIMELFYSSGLRVSELVGLNKSDFDPIDLLIKVRGKGRKERIIPLTKNAAEWILSYLHHPERNCDTDGHAAEKDAKAIFLNRHGYRLSPRSVDRKFDKYLRSSGLAGHVTPHTIRHTIATHWLENGMDLKMIQTILGHSCLSTTTIYTQVSAKLKIDVHKKAHPRA